MRGIVSCWVFNWLWGSYSGLILGENILIFLQIEVHSEVAVTSYHFLNYSNLLLAHEFLQGLSAYGLDCLFNPCSAGFPPPQLFLSKNTFKV